MLNPRDDVISMVGLLTIFSAHPEHKGTITIDKLESSDTQSLYEVGD